MARYIDAEDFTKRMEGYVEEYMWDVLEETPTAEVVEVKHGKWISRKNEPKHKDWWTCSECQGRFDYEWKFCPNCGADMRKETEDE